MVPGGPMGALPTPGKLRIQAVIVCTDRLFGCKDPKSRGKQPRSYAKVPKQSLSGKGSDRAQTTRRWAWKQPSFEESVIAHWSGSIAPKMYQGSSDSPKRRDRRKQLFRRVSSGTFCQSGKVFGDKTWRYQK